MIVRLLWLLCSFLIAFGASDESPENGEYLNTHRWNPHRVRARKIFGEALRKNEERDLSDTKKGAKENIPFRAINKNYERTESTTTTVSTPPRSFKSWHELRDEIHRKRTEGPKIIESDNFRKRERKPDLESESSTAAPSFSNFDEFIRDQEKALNRIRGGFFVTERSPDSLEEKGDAQNFRTSETGLRQDWSDIYDNFGTRWPVDPFRRKDWPIYDEETDSNQESSTKSSTSTPTTTTTRQPFSSRPKRYYRFQLGTAKPKSSSTAPSPVPEVKRENTFDDNEGPVREQFLISSTPISLFGLKTRTTSSTSRPYILATTTIPEIPITSSTLTISSVSQIPSTKVNTFSNYWTSSHQHNSNNFSPQKIPPPVIINHEEPSDLGAPPVTHTFTSTRIVPQPPSRAESPRTLKNFPRSPSFKTPSVLTNHPKPSINRPQSSAAPHLSTNVPTPSHKKLQPPVFDPYPRPFVKFRTTPQIKIESPRLESNRPFLNLPTPPREKIRPPRFDHDHHSQKPINERPKSPRFETHRPLPGPHNERPNNPRFESHPPSVKPTIERPNRPHFRSVKHVNERPHNLRFQSQYPNLPNGRPKDVRFDVHRPLKNIVSERPKSPRLEIHHQIRGNERPTPHGFESSNLPPPPPPPPQPSLITIQSGEKGKVLSSNHQLTNLAAPTTLQYIPLLRNGSPIFPPRISAPPRQTPIESLTFTSTSPSPPSSTEITFYDNEFASLDEFTAPKPFNNGFQRPPRKISQEFLPGIVQTLNELGLSTFSSLLTKHGLVKSLNLDSASFTFFAPTDSAFNKFNFDRLEDHEIIKILRSHMIDGRIDEGSFVNDRTGVTLSNSSIRTNIYETEDTNWREIKVKTVNGALITKFDVPIPNSGGLIHVIDRVLYPPSFKTIYQVLDEDPGQRFSTFLRALKAIKFDKVLQEVEKQAWTVFAPTNKAFRTLDPLEFEALKRDSKKLSRIIFAHVIPKTIYSTGVRQHELLSMTNGQALNIFSRGDRMKFEGGNVIEMDIPATNGVVQVIDRVAKQA